MTDATVAPPRRSRTAAAVCAEAAELTDPQPQRKPPWASCSSCLTSCCCCNCWWYWCYGAKADGLPPARAEPAAAPVQALIDCYGVDRHADLAGRRQ